MMRPLDHQCPLMKGQWQAQGDWLGPTRRPRQGAWPLHHSPQREAFQRKIAPAPQGHWWMIPAKTVAPLRSLLSGNWLTCDSSPDARSSALLVQLFVGSASILLSLLVLRFARAPRLAFYIVQKAVSAIAKVGWPSSKFYQQQRHFWTLLSNPKRRHCFEVWTTFPQAAGLPKSQKAWFQDFWNPVHWADTFRAGSSLSPNNGWPVIHDVRV